MLLLFKKIKKFTLKLFIEVHRLTQEQKEKIRKLIEKGFPPKEIARMMSVSYSTVYKLRPEVSERYKHYFRMYYRRKDLNFQEFLEALNGKGKISFNNPYFQVLECLNESKYGRKYKQIKSIFCLLIWTFLGIS